MRNTIQFASWLSKWNDWDQIVRISLATFTFVVAVVIVYGFRKRRKLSFFSKPRPGEKNQYDSNFEWDYQPRHNWHYNDLFTTPTYCNVCETLMVSGFCCSYCNSYSDDKCIKKADNSFQCKKLCNSIFRVEKKETHLINKTEQAALTDLKNGPFRLHKPTWSHHWIKGNLKLNTFCFLCMNECCDSPGLNDFKCVWCLRNVHEECLNTMSSGRAIEQCDCGKFKRILLTPNLLVQTKRSNNLSLKDVRLDEDLINFSLKNDPDEWTPLFVFANSKSGNNDAEAIIHSLTTVLNPLQIIEMNKMNPDMVAQWMAEYSHFVKFKILVCGGDGSVGWILESLSKVQFKKYEPSIGLLPLGTGNDLSRALNWGQGYVGDADIEEILSELNKATPINLDRWCVRISKPNKRSRKTSASSTSDEDSQLLKAEKKYMNNYISVGCDALVTLNFHRQRNDMFFANRLLNKLIYFKYGTIDTFMKECRYLTENIQLELDGELIELPHLESIVVLNIPYWGGGVKPWEIGLDESTPKQYINDGTLEIFGIYSSFHIAQLQVGLAEPYRIGQAKHVRMRLKKRFPVQIDGEPFELSPGTIDITFFNQKIMLTKVEPESVPSDEDLSE